jgi:hypothetical protein
MRDSRLNSPVTDTEIDEMAEYYEFAEATGGFKSVRGFKLTPEEDRDLSDTEKAAKYRKATLDAVDQEHRGKPVQRVHWVYGAPGSGKTARTSLGHLLVPDASEAAHTNPDDYKRFHKRWNFGEGSGESHQFSRDQSGRTLQEALEEGMDVVVQGTGKDGLLMNSVLFPGRDHRNGRRSDTASVMHYLHVPDDERSRRIADRRTNQRRRYGAEPEDAMNVLDQVVKYVEEGRIDEAHIYDNGGSIDEAPPLVATFKDGHLVIYDEDKFNEIFDPKDSDGDPVLFRGKVADRPAVTRYSQRDDPRRGKTYAERLREEGENPGGFRKWDEARREKAIRAPGSLASRRGDEGENLQDAYRRHLKAKGIQTDGERAFEEQYGYELRSGDGDCYSASYRAAVELAEKGVDADGDPVTNVRVVVGSPVFPKVGERSGHAWVEYDAVKPPPPLMSSADRDHAKEQILVLVEGMDLPPKQKQATIDSFLEAIDRANEANAAAPVRDVTMVRDYASVRDGDDILEFDDMDRGRLEALKPDMARDVYYRAGEMEEVDIAGRFSPAEYEETQVSLFGGDFYDGDATFLTREQVDQHLEDMGIDGGFESKRTDDADAEDERLHNEAIGQLREIFAEAGAEQSDTILDQLAYEMRSSPRGMMGGRDAPIKPDYLEAIRELVEERDPEFMEDLAETLRIRQTTEGYRRLTESGLDSGVGVHNQETSPIRGIFDGHIKDGDPITLYHGGPVDLTGDVDYEVSRNDSGQWGPGIYTTASAFPAIKGWANPWQRNAEGGYDTVDPGHLHTTRWKGENPPQILDVMDPLPDDVLDGVAIPAIESLLREIKKSSQAERRDNWKIKYLEEELEATLDFIDRKRGEVTGPETLLQIQKYMQEGDVAYGRGELDGFLPSDRLDLIRNQMNAAIKDLGYDVVKSHEVGIREMSRTDYMFLDPDMVEFVEVATTHSLAGFGNMSGGEMGSTVRRRAKATREAAGGGLKSSRQPMSAAERETTIAVISESLKVAGLDPLDDADMKKLKEAKTISFGQNTGPSAARADGVEVYGSNINLEEGGSIIVGVPQGWRAEVKRQGVKTLVDEITPEEKDIIEKAVGPDRVEGLVNRIHDHWTRVSGGHDSGALLTQLSMARTLGWDDEKIQREIFHAVPRVEWDEEAQDFVPRNINYAELKKRAAKVVKNLGPMDETQSHRNMDHRRNMIRKRATGRNSGERAIVQTLALEHYYGEAYQAVLAAEQRATVKRLKALGIEKLTLYRGVIFDGSEADHLDALIGQPPQTLGADRPGSALTAWSITEETARGFANMGMGANEPDLTGFVMKSEVSIDDIVGLSTNGFGCLSEGECIVRHGKQTIQVLERFPG